MTAGDAAEFRVDRQTSWVELETSIFNLEL